MLEAALSHFGFTELPFSSDWRGEIFESKDFRDTRTAVDSAIERHSKLLVTAPIGAGKTEAADEAIRRAKERWDRTAEEPLLVVPLLARAKNQLTVSAVEDTLHDALGISGSSRREVRARRLHQALESRLASGGRVALVIDEAHDLTARVLRELKTLHELRSSTGRPLFAMILVAQDTIRSFMKIHALHLWQRIRVHELKGLRRDEIEPYLRLKLEEAGAPKTFSPDAIGAVKKSQATWLPLDLNQLCQQALHDAWRRGEKQVSAETVEIVLRPNLLFALMKQKGLSQNELAGVSGVPASTLSTFFTRPEEMSAQKREEVRSKLVAGLTKTAAREPDKSRMVIGTPVDGAKGKAA
ncbi:MAG: AAA family ATPase [Deltaproteobacteria bacterium]|nr:AAA family ATPase [Deltaproteobacteria bacterium]